MRVAEPCAQALLSLASALYGLAAAATPAGPLDAVALGDAVAEAVAARAVAAAELRIVAARAPNYHDDLARLAALVQGGATGPAQIAQAAEWVAVVESECQEEI